MIDLEKGESDSGFNNEAKSNIDNDQNDEWFVKSILIVIKV